MKTLTGLVIGALALTAVLAATPALADGQGNKLMTEIEMKVSNKAHAAVIAERRMAMRALSGSMKKIAAFMKKNEGTAADVKAAAMKIEEIAKSVHAKFPAGTGMADYPGFTGAKPAVHSDAAGFKEVSLKMASLAADLAKAVESGASKGDLGAKSVSYTHLTLPTILRV